MGAEYVDVARPRGAYCHRPSARLLPLNPPTFFLVSILIAAPWPPRRDERDGADPSSPLDVAVSASAYSPRLHGPSRTEVAKTHSAIDSEAA